GGNEAEWRDEHERAQECATRRDITFAPPHPCGKQTDEGHRRAQRDHGLEGVVDDGDGWTIRLRNDAEPLHFSMWVVKGEQRESVWNLDRPSGLLARFIGNAADAEWRAALGRPLCFERCEFDGLRQGDDASA